MDFFASVDRDKLLVPVNQRVSDGRVPGLIKQILEAGCVATGKLYEPFVRRTEASPAGHLLRPDTAEVGEPTPGDPVEGSGGPDDGAS